MSKEVKTAQSTSSKDTKVHRLQFKSWKKFISMATKLDGNADKIICRDIMRRDVTGLAPSFKGITEYLTEIIVYNGNKTEISFKKVNRRVQEDEATISGANGNQIRNILLTQEYCEKLKNKFSNGAQIVGPLSNMTEPNRKKWLDKAKIIFC